MFYDLNHDCSEQMLQTDRGMSRGSGIDMECVDLEQNVDGP